MDRQIWWAALQGIAKSWTELKLLDTSTLKMAAKAKLNVGVMLVVATVRRVRGPNLGGGDWLLSISTETRIKEKRLNSKRGAV